MRLVKGKENALPDSIFFHPQSDEEDYDADHLIYERSE